jgi:hypothetical protein
MNTGDRQSDLFHVPVTFYCPVHGTVSECPWRFMSCTEQESHASGAIPDWVRQRAEQPNGEKTVTYQTWLEHR